MGLYHLHSNFKSVSFLSNSPLYLLDKDAQSVDMLYEFQGPSHLQFGDHMDLKMQFFDC
jgi:hypothetical protein